MMLVNGYLVYKYLEEKKLTFQKFANGVALAMCAKVREGVG